MNDRRRHCCLLIAWFLLARDLPAQLVRGRVTEVNSTSPVAGALVSLLPASADSALVSVLTTPAGGYTVRAPAAGRYRLAIKRIGVKRFISTPFELGAGETRIIDASIEAVAQALPSVDVSGLCVARDGDRPMVASLWDEVRTALDATGISFREQLIRARIYRYVAELDPADLRVLYDWPLDVESLSGQPFTSLSGDSLARIGYWRVTPGDSVEYMAPDAAALASNAFLRDHCFSLASQRSDRPELVGLDFRSISRRMVPGITGTIWIDASRFELRLVEFRYTRLPSGTPELAHAGGEVHFTRLSNGAWFVDRWFIRTPQVIRIRRQEDNTIRAREGLTRRAILEGGGTVMTDEKALSPASATVTGVLVDSANRPLGGAIVRVVGTGRETVTATDGSYRIDSLPAGDVAIVARVASYDSLAMVAGTQRVDLRTGASVDVNFTAPDATTLRSLFCASPNVNRFQEPGGEGVLRLQLVDSVTALPVRGVAMIVAWPPTRAARMGRPERNRYQAAVTDIRGAASFCGLPHGIPLELIRMHSDTLGVPVLTFQTTRSGIVSRVIKSPINP